MENLKIEVVGDEAKSKEAQELFFKLGYDWVYTTMVNVTVGIIYSDRDGYLTVNPVSGIRDYKETTLQELRDKVVLKRNDVSDATHVRYDGKKYFHAKSTDYFYHFSNDKEWLLSNWMNDQLLPQLKPIKESTMTTPPKKEYLDPHNNYELIEWDGGFMIQEHWIEVPMGAESYMMTSAHAQRGIFYKKGWYEFLEAYERSNWKQTGYSNKNYKSEMLEKGCALVWQRATQPEELPFIDDEPKLHSIDVTLAERQSTYGDFRDVANTTGQLMGILRNSKNGHTLPYMHEEALHMICSKMARLVNGDPTHKDSWHDIAGYAKLVEDSL